MLLSMTGYAVTTIELPQPSGNSVILSIELKSLNARFFELSARLPASISILETDMLGVLKEKLGRGRVFLSMQSVGGGEPLTRVVPSYETARVYITALSKLAQESGISGTLSISDLVHLPDLFVTTREQVSDQAREAILAGIARAADALCVMRAAEGERLERDIVARLARCSSALASIRTEHERLMKAQSDLVKSLQEDSVAHPDDEQVRAKLADAYSGLERMDIAEELTRFASHLVAAEEAFASRESEKGKRLDFLSQEFVREANTIASKCNDAVISAHVVDIKVELEKVREQVQNVL